MLEVYLLGRFEVLLDGQPLDLPSRPAQSLLAYLALHPGVAHRREQLAGLLWPDSEESNARRYLSQALWRLRKRLGKAYFQAEKLSLAFNPQPEDRLDVQILSDPGGQSPEEARMRSLSVYKGRLLPGFYEDWAWEQAEHFQALFERRCQSLLDGLVKERRWQEILEWGERWLRLGETPEPAYRALMQAHAGLGDQAGVAGVYRRSAAALERDLGVEPSAETVDLFKRLRLGPSDGSPSQAIAAPTFMELDEPPDAPRPVFVARDQVLEQLEGYLEKVLDGRGQVAFIVGEAGQGKTSLLSEFLHRLPEMHAGVLAAFGSCSAYTGGGDPYLPFRELMGILTGDVEAAWRAGQLPTALVRRIWKGLPEMVEALVARGPNLAGALFSGVDLHVRAKAAGIDGSLLERLEGMIEKKGDEEGMQQDFLFEQTANVLRRLSKTHPLVLFLDDLHWADESSTDLLFHLGRRVQGSRVLLLGAYRPEDLAQKRNGQPRPLQGLVRELQRMYGEVVVDLDADSRTHLHAFVAAYLDSEPNRLEEDFRRALAVHTGGHPLFTVETLREMQARGDIEQDEAGAWVAGPGVSWEVLAARVEGVIANRISRLSPEANEMLTIASVEGEAFTAEVLAEVLGREVRPLVRMLNGPLARRHHLVREGGVVRLEGEKRRRLSRFRFRHSLFQRYLYARLGEAERAYLHEDVGRALEKLYEGRTEEVAVQLARHFREAGDVGREIRYLRQAGERAAAGYANEEAANYMSRALLLIPEEDHKRRYDLLLAREKLYSLQGKYEACGADLAVLEGLAEQIGDLHKKAEVANERVTYLHRRGKNSVESLIEHTHAALDLAKTSNSTDLEAEGYLYLAAFGPTNDSEKCLRYNQIGLELARKVRNLAVEAWALRQIGEVYAFMKFDFSKAEHYLQQALRIHQEMNKPGWGGIIHDIFGALFTTQGAFNKAYQHYQEALNKYNETGFQIGQLRTINNIAWCFLMRGEFSTAALWSDRAIELAAISGSLTQKSIVLADRGYFYWYLGDYERAEERTKESIDLIRDLGSEALLLGPSLIWSRISASKGDHKAALHHGQAALNFARNDFPIYIGEALINMGNAYSGLGQIEDAANTYQEALIRCRERNQEHLASEALAGLARLALNREECCPALTYVEEILAHLKTGSLEGANEPFFVFLTCFIVLEENKDPRAQSVLRTAYDLLMQYAGNISNDKLRTSFLENVPGHLEIVRLWQAAQNH